MLFLLAKKVELLAVVLKEMGTDAIPCRLLSAPSFSSERLPARPTYASRAACDNIDLACEVRDVLIGIEHVVAVAEHAVL